MTEQNITPLQSPYLTIGGNMSLILTSPVNDNDIYKGAKDPFKTLSEVGVNFIKIVDELSPTEEQRLFLADFMRDLIIEGLR